MATSSAPRARRSKRLVVLVVLLILLLLLLLVVWSAVAALQARTHLLAARDAVTEATGGEVEGDRIDALQTGVDAAAGRAREAHRLMLQPGPAVLSRVPLLGRSLAAQRDVTAAAAASLAAAQDLLPLVREVQVEDGAVDLPALDRLAAGLDDAADRVREPVARLERAPLGLTPSVVREAVEQAREPLDGLPGELERAAAGTRAGAGLLGRDGPRSLVLAVMNNAELRGAGGYASSFTVLRTEGGRISVEPFQDANEVFDPPELAVRVPAPAEYAERWGPLLADTTLGKNALVSPHVPASASVLCEVVQVRSAPGCDGVVLLDVPALAELITLTGPVRLPDGSEVGGDDLVRELLVDAYAEIGTEDESGEQRRVALRAAADAGLSEVLRGGLTGLDALRVLVDAAQGRHLAIWSADDQEQQALEAAGVSGSVDPGPDDLLLVAMNQFGGSKLDYYADRGLAVSVVVGQETARVETTVSLGLDLPDGLPDYVLGSSGGRLTGILDLGFGAQATVLAVERDGAPVPVSVLTESGGTRVPLEVDVADGATTTWRVVHEVPVQDGRYRLRLLPQPLARDAALDLRVEAADGLELDAGPVRLTERLSSSTTVEVRASEPSWWSRPVQIGSLR